MTAYSAPGITKRKVYSFLEQVSHYTNVSTEEIIGRKRDRKISDARHIYLALVKNNTKLCLKEVGNLINRDHATVLHAVGKIKNLCEIDNDIKRRCKYLEQIGNFNKLI